jgi:hypothetical protein
MSDDIVVVDPLAFIRRQPWRFFGAGGANPLAALEQLVGDAVALGFECTACRVLDWWVAHSCADWLHSQHAAPHELFFRIVPAPELGVNAMRHEVLLGAFAADVWTFDGQWRRILGEREVPDAVAARAMGDVCRAIAFRWPAEP